MLDIIVNPSWNVFACLAKQFSMQVLSASVGAALFTLVTQAFEHLTIALALNSIDSFSNNSASFITKINLIMIIDLIGNSKEIKEQCH